MTYHTPLAQQHARRNWLAFFGDYIFFGIGLMLTSTATTLPAFAATLTDDKVLIGAVSATWFGAWLLPQVLGANYLSNKPNKYPIMVRGMLIGRPVFIIFVAWMLLGGLQYPFISLLLFILTLGYFSGTDALVALAWFDLFGKALTPDARSRMVGIAQAVTGVIAIGMGAWIQWVLGPTGPAYPLNYIWLFGVATVCYGLSMASNVFIVEIPESVEDQRPSLRRYLPQLVELWKSDKAFSRVTTARLLVGLGGLATTFYVVYATEVLQLPASAIGLYATATTLGSAFAGLTLGAVASRFGSQRVVQITCWVEVCIPLFALLCYTGTLGEALPMLFPLLFFLLGVFEGSIMLGFMNFVLEIAPAGQRPTYMGLTNTLSGLMVLIPLIGGVILKYTSYPVLFILAAVGTFLGALVAMGLRNPRQPALPTETPLEQVAL